MTTLPRRSRKRKSQTLPLFEWADQNDPVVFEALLITSKLAQQVDTPISTLNAMAEANGYIGRIAT